MVRHREPQPENDTHKKLIAFYAGTSLWERFNEQCIRIGTTPFVMLRNLMRSFVVNEEEKGE